MPDVFARRYRFGDATINLEAPPDVLAILDLTLARVPVHESGHLDVALRLVRGDGWEIQRTSDGRATILEPHCALPEVAGALVTTMMDIARTRTDGELLRAVVVERDGAGLALVGDDWESSVMIAAHLNLRGWRFVSGHYSFLDPASMLVRPVQKLLAVTSTLLPLLPLEYRSAVEVSRWYSSRDGLLFYTIDPHAVLGDAGWSPSTTLRSCLIVSGAAEPAARVEEPNDDDIARYVPHSATLDQRVRLGSILLGAPAPTADAVERWERSSPITAGA